jgi:hypothetical protein
MTRPALNLTFSFANLWTEGMNSITGTNQALGKECQ